MAANNNAFWARPGSASAAELEKTEAEPVTETQPQPQPVNSDAAASAATATQPVAAEAGAAPKSENGELDLRSKQADFFNSMSGVENAETEYHEAYISTGLLEVPYRDTAHNLGYRIPKLRLSISKQAKRKAAIFSSIFGSIAAAIALIIVLNSIFGFIPTVKQVPVFYSKGGKVYMTSSTGRFPEQMLFDGTVFQFSQNSDKIQFVPNSEDVLVISDIDSGANTYSLYLRKNMKISEQGKLIDSNIMGSYEFAFGSKSVLYVKSKGTNDLYFRNLSSDSSKLIERKIEIFGMLTDSTAVIKTTGGTVSIIDLNRDGSFVINEVSKSVKELYLDNGKSNAFYFIKTERNTETSEYANFLFRYSGGRAEKVAENVESLVAYSCADNWAYYSNKLKINYPVTNFIDDDLAENDAKLINAIIGLDISQEQGDAILRERLRRDISKASIAMTYTNLLYYANGSSTELETACTEIYAVDLDGEFISLGKKSTEGYNENKSGLTDGKKAAIMYETVNVLEENILFSSIPETIIKSHDAVDELKSMIKKNVFDRYESIIVDDRKISVASVEFEQGKTVFSSDYSSFYYIANSSAQADDSVESGADADSGNQGSASAAEDDLAPVNPNARAESDDNAAKADAENADGGADENSQAGAEADGEAEAASYGDLMCINLKSGDNSAQPIAVDVERFLLLADGAVMYLSSDGTAYVGSVAVANRVKSISANRSRNAVVILSNTNDSGSRLTVYKDGATKPIADNVNSVVFNGDESISFIKDYDKTKISGDLYICRDFGVPSRVDSGVASLVSYPY